MIVSSHAKEEMQRSNISEEEIIQCLQHGELIIKQVIAGEMRYGKQIDFKEKRIVVIYTHQQDNERIITTYLVRRKRQW